MTPRLAILLAGLLLAVPIPADVRATPRLEAALELPGENRAAAHPPT